MPCDIEWHAVPSMHGAMTGSSNCGCDSSLQSLQRCTDPELNNTRLS